MSTAGCAWPSTKHPWGPELFCSLTWVFARLGTLRLFILPLPVVPGILGHCLFVIPVSLYTPQCSNISLFGEGSLHFLALSKPEFPFKIISPSSNTVFNFAHVLCLKCAFIHVLIYKWCMSPDVLSPGKCCLPSADVLLFPVSTLQLELQPQHTALNTVHPSNTTFSVIQHKTFNSIHPLVACQLCNFSTTQRTTFNTSCNFHSVQHTQDIGIAGLIPRKTVGILRTELCLLNLYAFSIWHIGDLNIGKTDRKRAFC